MRITSITLVLLSMLVISASPAATYKWTDENGNVVYSQQPPKSGAYEVIKGLPHSRTPAPAANTSSQTGSKPATDSSPSPSNSGGEQSAADERIKKQNCAAAKKNLDILKVYTRIRNEDGTVTRLDEAERQKRIEEAESQIRLFCN